jgi:hypothetical protein
LANSSRQIGRYRAAAGARVPQPKWRFCQWLETVEVREKVFLIAQSLSMSWASSSSLAARMLSKLAALRGIQTKGILLQGISV